MGKKRCVDAMLESRCLNSGRCRLEKACESDGGVLAECPDAEAKGLGLLNLPTGGVLSRS
jgi:hypothetical protein